jgi:hypothetical protein
MGYFCEVYKQPTFHTSFQTNKHPGCVSYKHEVNGNRSDLTCLGHVRVHNTVRLCPDSSPEHVHIHNSVSDGTMEIGSVMDRYAYVNVFSKTFVLYNVSKLRRYIHTPFTVATTRFVQLDVTGILYSENRYRTDLSERYLEPSMARTMGVARANIDNNRSTSDGRL